jgi:hypothetical protein
MQAQHWQDVIFPALATLLTALAGLVARAVGKYFATKTKIMSADAASALFEKVADDAIHYAEQWASNKGKAGPAPNGADKMSAALDRAVSEASRLGLVDAGTEALRGAIEARLGKLRASVAPPPAPAPVAVPLAVAAPVNTVKP